MRIVVMGAGGTGGYFGAKLARGGSDVTFVARGAHLAAIQKRGLRADSALEGEFAVRPPAMDRLAGQAPADLVLFCVKSFDTEAAAEIIRPAVGPDTAILSIQNGVDNEERLAHLFGPRRVIGGVAQVFATIAAPGVIKHVLLGRLLVGELDGADSERVRRFLGACERADIPAERSPRITRTLWDKYVCPAAQAGMAALTGWPVGVLRAIPETRAMSRRIIDEMSALAAAVGAGLDEAYADTCMTMIDALAPGAYASLHHDLVHGKRLEL